MDGLQSFIVPWSAKPVGWLEGFGHFVEDGLGGFGGVWVVGDGAADNEEAGALAQRLGRGGDAALIAFCRAGGADAGGDQNALRTGESAEGGDFLRGGDEAADAGGEAHAGQQFNLLGGGARDPDGVGLRLIHAGKDGDGEEFRGMGEAVERSAGRGQHGGSAGGVDVDHVHAQRGGRTNRSGDGVGYVVELEVEKDTVAALEQRFNHGGAGGGEQLHADFEPGAGALKPLDERGGGGGVGEVEGHDEALARFFQGVGDGESGRPRGGECGVQPLWDGHPSILRHSLFWWWENRQAWAAMGSGLEDERTLT